MQQAQKLPLGLPVWGARSDFRSSGGEGKAAGEAGVMRVETERWNKEDEERGARSNPDGVLKFYQLPETLVCHYRVSAVISLNQAEQNT